MDLVRTGCNWAPTNHFTAVGVSFATSIWHHKLVFVGRTALRTPEVNKVAETRRTSTEDLSWQSHARVKNVHLIAIATSQRRR
jgi:hypothetical protein